MKNLIKVLTLSLLLAFITACGMRYSDYSYIPGNAGFVAKIDLPALVEKSNINYVRDSVGFGLMETGFSFFGVPNFMKDRSITGINYQKNIYAFKSDSTKDAPIVAMFSIANEDSLHHFIQSLDKAMFTKRSKKTTSVHFSFGTIVYKDERAYFTPRKDTATTALLTDFFKMKKNKSLEGMHPDVVTKLKADDDIGMWTNQRKLMDFESPLALTNKKEALVKKTIAAVNFNKGNVKMSYGELGNEKLTTLYNQALDGEYNEELLRGLPKNELPGIISFHVKPATHQMQMDHLNWFEHLAETNGYSSYASRQFSQLMNQLSNHFNGSSIWGIMGFKALKETDEDGLFKQDIEETYFNWHIAIGLADPAAIDSLLAMNAGAAFGKLEAGKMFYSFPGAPFPFHFTVDNGILLISNDEKHLQDMLTKELPVPQWDGALNGELEEFPVYANINPAMWNIMTDSRQEMSAQGILTSMTGNALLAVDRMKVLGYSDDNIALRMDIEMNFKNKSKNSLELLLVSMFEKLTFESMKGAF